MATKLKVNTKVNSMQDVQKSLIEIEKNFNVLLSRINSPAETQLPETKGNTGDIQITENPDKSFSFEVKTKTGWKTPVIGNSAVKFKDKPKVKDVPKSIDEIETNDTSTGAANAKKTIYDEKNDKFVMPRPDYESDWTNVDHDTNYPFTHNLGTKIFKLVQIIFKDDSDRIFYPGFQTDEGSHDIGMYVHAQTDDIMDVATANTYVYTYDNTSLGGTIERVADGYIKLLLWK